MGKDLKREVSAGGSGEGRRLWAVPAQSLDGHARRTEQDWAQDLVRDPRRQLRGLDPAGQVRERLCGQHVAVRERLFGAILQYFKPSICQDRLDRDRHRTTLKKTHTFLQDGG
jgi:hypothetical protein